MAMFSQRKQHQSAKFAEELSKTSEAAVFIRTEIRKLQDVSKKNDPIIHKINLMEAQLKFYEGIVESMTHVNASLQRQATQSRDYQHQHDTIYAKMTEVLCTVMKGFHFVLGAPEKWFTKTMQRIGDFTSRNPKTSIAAIMCSIFLGGGLAGEFGLWGVSVASWSNGALFITGGVIGLCVCLALFGLIKLYKHFNPTRVVHDQELQMRKKLEDMIHRMKKTPLSDIEAEFDKLNTMLSNHFGKPIIFSEELALEECLICHEAFGSSKPERAINCKGQHFMHQACWGQWRQLSQDRRCLICRT